MKNRMYELVLVLEWEWESAEEKTLKQCLKYKCH